LILFTGAPISLDAPSHIFFTRAMIVSSTARHFASNPAIQTTPKVFARRGGQAEKARWPACDRTDFCPLTSDL